MRAMQIPSDHPLLLRIVDDLAERGWSQQNLFLPEALTRALAAECRQRAAEGELAPAAVGRGPFSEIREGIRGIASSGSNLVRRKPATITWR